MDKTFPESRQYKPAQWYYNKNGCDILNYETQVDPGKMTLHYGQLENPKSLLISPGNTIPIDRSD
jgi:hypothetical protein